MPTLMCGCAFSSPIALKKYRGIVGLWSRCSFCKIWIVRPEVHKNSYAEGNRVVLQNAPK